MIKMGKDDRFDETRDNFFKFLGFWIFQVISCDPFVHSKVPAHETGPAFIGCVGH